jgi:hypothetical protein
MRVLTAGGIEIDFLSSELDAACAMLRTLQSEPRISPTRRESVLTTARAALGTVRRHERHIEDIRARGEKFTRERRNSNPQSLRFQNNSPPKRIRTNIYRVSSTSTDGLLWGGPDNTGAHVASLPARADQMAFRTDFDHRVVIDVIAAVSQCALQVVANFGVCGIANDIPS